MENLSQETKALIKSMKRVISDWEKDTEKLKESYEIEPSASKQIKIGDKIRKLESRIDENRALIEVIENERKLIQQ